MFLGTVEKHDLQKSNQSGDSVHVGQHEVSEHANVDGTGGGFDGMRMEVELVRYWLGMK